MARVSVALPWKTGATSLCLNLPPKLELESQTTNKKVQIEMCVCVCGIQPSSLVNEGGKGLFKREKDKKTIIDIYWYLNSIYTHTYI